ncbi:MAG TPA: VOC family protein [Rhizomicrobium sp.]|jgi:catechol 2,3-dioxygenase-like lactoylglutathione lyase family enzyme
MPLAVTGIDHVQIAVPRRLEAECLAFYRQVFGFREIPKPEELRGRGGAWFEVAPGGMQMHIGVDPEPSPKSKRHVCFLVENVSAARAEMEARGIAIEDESVAEGLHRIFVRDPAGNRIEIGTRL